MINKPLAPAIEAEINNIGIAKVFEHAAANNDLDTVTWMLNQYNATIDNKNQLRLDLALKAAIVHHNNSVAARLIQNYALDPHLQIHQALMTVVTTDNLDLFNEILTACSNSAEIMQKIHISQAFLFAIEHKKVNIATYIYNHTKDIYDRYQQLLSFDRALRSAASSNFIELLQKMLTHHVKNYAAAKRLGMGWVLRSAAEFGNLEAVKHIFNRCNYISYLHKYNYLPPATARYNPDVCQLDPDMKDILQANWALAIAAQNNHLEVVKYIITTYGQDDSLKINFAFKIAAEHNHHQVVQYLLEQNNKLDVAAALSLAAQNNSTEVIKCLLLMGIQDPDLLNRLDVSETLKYTAKNNKIDVLEKLIQYCSESNNATLFNCVIMLNDLLSGKSAQIDVLINEIKIKLTAPGNLNRQLV